MIRNYFHLMKHWKLLVLFLNYIVYLQKSVTTKYFILLEGFVYEDIKGLRLKAKLVVKRWVMWQLANHY